MRKKLDRRTAKERQRFTLAFFGLRSSRAGEEFFGTALEWFNELGYAPDRLGIVGPGWSNKVGTFRRGKPKLDRRGFTHVNAFQLEASDPDAPVPWSQCLVSAYFSAHFCQGDGGRCAVMVPLSRVIRKTWLPVAQKIVRNLRPHYGIGFIQDVSQHPDSHAMYGGGLGWTGKAYEASRNDQFWSHEGLPRNVLREGVLRNVYPWNFLTKPQLTRDIGGIPLKQWITETDGAGTLEELNFGVSLWQVPRAAIPKVRRKLQEAEAMFNWQTYSWAQDPAQ